MGRAMAEGLIQFIQPNALYFRVDMPGRDLRFVSIFRIKNIPNAVIDANAINAMLEQLDVRKGTYRVDEWLYVMLEVPWGWSERTSKKIESAIAALEGFIGSDYPYYDELIGVVSAQL